MFKTPCLFYNKPGGCRNGSSCRYDHVDPAHLPTAYAATEGNSAYTSSCGNTPLGVCSFYWRNGNCRHGSQCRFSHERGSKVAIGGNSTYANSCGDVPPGTCSFYWRSGNCKHGFQCRFRHERGSDAAVEDFPSSTLSTTSTPGVSTALLPLLTPAGIARLSGAGGDVLFASNMQAKNPTEVHNYLKRYLYDNYQFRNAPDMHSFLALLTDATSSNCAWVSGFVYQEHPATYSWSADCGGWAGEISQRYYPYSMFIAMSSYSYLLLQR